MEVSKCRNYGIKKANVEIMESKTGFLPGISASTRYYKSIFFRFIEDQ